eukprot:11329984-Heterocapsa_arctica.AAC.1
MPAGYTVCASCHSPFIFEEVVNDVPLKCKGPTAAPAMVMPRASDAPDAKEPRVFTPAQLA